MLKGFWWGFPNLHHKESLVSQFCVCVFVHVSVLQSLTSTVIFVIITEFARSAMRKKKE